MPTTSLIHTRLSICWVSLGAYDFSANTGYVKLNHTGLDSDQTSGANNRVVQANAVSFVAQEIDFGDYRYVESSDGNWTTSTAAVGWDGGTTRYSNVVGANAAYTPQLQSGSYDVKVFVPVHSTSNSTTDARYTLTLNGTTVGSPVTANQKNDNNGTGYWLTVASNVSVTAGNAVQLKVENTGAAGTYLRVNAAKFMRK